MKDNRSHLLRIALLTDAGASLICGGAALVLADPLTHWTGIASWILYALGVGLAIFAADVALTATRDPINRFFVKVIIAANVAWVGGSVLVLLLYSDRLTMIGQLMVEVIAIFVATVTTVETVGLKRLGGHTSSTKPRTA